MLLRLRCRWQPLAEQPAVPLPAAQVHGLCFRSQSSGSWCWAQGRSSAARLEGRCKVAAGWTSVRALRASVLVALGQ